MLTDLLAAGPPAAVTDELDRVLGIIAWLVTAAGVMGLLIVGFRMSLSLRSGDGRYHMTQFATVMGACVIGTTAGPIVQFLL
ncbi:MULTISPECIES: hypothetical protein [Streptomyces]|uniref:Uncharacterized protein n=1 Tax=Streptomyces lycii TaxID=2654337 RepID=A0ABQ7FQU1_9ACTN|nr:MULTISPECIES: hypothetical protein [Streptomyces]KAF4410151.1 hypothetical protein GCU69_05415 [Streptomyces lycii]PGH46843.1 hypothetical protein CRI70_31800 [Streptomyces sp. Ru87]